MNSKIVAALAAVILTFGAVMLAFAVPAGAQSLSGSWTCEARSPNAYGRGIWYDVDTACARAISECQIRTPYYQACQVTRYWYNY